MDGFTNKLIKELSDTFRDNLLCVLLLGSVQKDDITPFSDIDLVAVIESFDFNKIQDIRCLLKNSEELFDLSFICWNEISKDPNFFSFGTHGCYQLGLILNKAECLYGRNILLDLGLPKEENIKYSLFQKNIQYTWWARRMFVESNRIRSLEDNYKLNSRLIKMIRGLLYIEEDFNIHSVAEEAIARFIEKYRHLLEEEERGTVIGLVNKSMINKNVSNMSESYLALRVSIVNKIHKEAVKFFF